MRVSTKNRTSIAIFIFEIWTGITAFSIKFPPPGWWRQMLGEWSIENEKYADFLGIWYKNLQIWPQIKKLLRNFETSKWKIFKQLKVSINLQFIIKKMNVSTRWLLPIQHIISTLLQRAKSASWPVRTICGARGRRGSPLHVRIHVFYKKIGYAPRAKSFLNFWRFKG